MHTPTYMVVATGLNSDHDLKLLLQNSNQQSRGEELIWDACVAISVDLPITWIMRRKDGVHAASPAAASGVEHGVGEVHNRVLHLPPCP